MGNRFPGPAGEPVDLDGFLKTYGMTSDQLQLTILEPGTDGCLPEAAQERWTDFVAWATDMKRAPPLRYTAVDFVDRNAPALVAVEKAMGDQIKDKSPVHAVNKREDLSLGEIGHALRGCLTALPALFAADHAAAFFYRAKTGTIAAHFDGPSNLGDMCCRALMLQLVHLVPSVPGAYAGTFFLDPRSANVFVWLLREPAVTSFPFALTKNALHGSVYGPCDHFKIMLRPDVAGPAAYSGAHRALLQAFLEQPSVILLEAGTAAGTLSACGGSKRWDIQSQRAGGQAVRQRPGLWLQAISRGLFGSGDPALQMTMQGGSYYYAQRQEQAPNRQYDPTQRPVRASTAASKPVLGAARYGKLAVAVRVGVAVPSAIKSCALPRMSSP